MAGFHYSSNERMILGRAGIPVEGRIALAVTFNESYIAAEAFGRGVRRQRLLTEARVAGTSILLDRLTIEPRAALELEVSAKNLAWFQMLEGDAALELPEGDEPLSKAHVAFLPPRFRCRLASREGATLLHAEVLDAARFDAGLTAHPPSFRIVDWTREPVLDSEHDARKRIYLVTPKLFGTRAIKGEMIIYPPGTAAANHHHEGAEHFMYILQGRGVAYANERPFPVRKGDVVYFRDLERHYFAAEGSEDMVFTEFFVPGEYKTLWVDASQVCTWLPTGRDIRGRAPVREIKGHSSAEFASPQDV